MAKLNFGVVERIVKKFDLLLVNQGVKNPSYDVCFCPEQGVGFFPKNKETTEAIMNISSNKYNLLLDGLLRFTKKLQDEYILDRSYFYKRA